MSNEIKIELTFEFQKNLKKSAKKYRNNKTIQL